MSITPSSCARCDAQLVQGDMVVPVRVVTKYWGDGTLSTDRGNAVAHVECPAQPDPTRAAAPAADERDALALAMLGWSKLPDESNCAWPQLDYARVLAGMALATGYRRQGPVTDAEVEAAAIALYLAEYPLADARDWPSVHPDFASVYRRRARAALEAAKHV